MESPKLRKMNTNQIKKQSEKNQLRFSKIFIKHHAFNRRIMRMKEYNRYYNIRPSKVLKMILEKEPDLDNAKMPEMNS